MIHINTSLEVRAQKRVYVGGGSTQEFLKGWECIISSIVQSKFFSSEQSQEFQETNSQYWEFDHIFESLHNPIKACS